MTQNKAFENLYSFTPKGVGESSRVATYRTAMLVAEYLGVAVVRSAVPASVLNECRAGAIRYMRALDEYEVNGGYQPRSPHSALRAAEKVIDYYTKAKPTEAPSLGKSVRLNLYTQAVGLEVLQRQEEGPAAHLIISGECRLQGAPSHHSEGVALPLDPGDLVLLAPANAGANTGHWAVGYAQEAAPKLQLSIRHQVR